MGEQPSRSDDDLIDQAAMESFPASDPPGYRSASIGGPSLDLTPRVAPKPTRDWSRTTAAIQAAYFIATGIAPFVSRSAFERITGRKQDWWLVQTVGVVVTAVGVGLGSAAIRNRVTPEIRAIGVGSAAGIGIVETYHRLRGRVSSAYLIDAAIEVALIAGWLRQRPARPKPLSLASR